MAHGILLIKAYFPKKSQTDLVNALTQASHPRLLRATITNLLGSSSIGHGGVGLVAQAGSVAPVQATSSFTCTAASATVGDKLIILGPQGPITLTCVAANTENPFIGQYSVGGGTNNNLATSIRTAINSYPALRQIVSAAGSTNTVALTAVPEGGAGNLLKLVKQVTTSGVFSFTSGVAFSGGVDVSGSASLTVTVGTNPADADTLKFGNVTLTWKTAGSGHDRGGYHRFRRCAGCGHQRPFDPRWHLLGHFGAGRGHHHLHVPVPPRVPHHDRLEHRQRGREWSGPERRYADAGLDQEDHCWSVLRIAHVHVQAGSSKLRSQAQFRRAGERRQQVRRRVPATVRFGFSRELDGRLRSQRHGSGHAGREVGGTGREAPAGRFGSSHEPVQRR